jgi:hypothetical protein
MALLETSTSEGAQLGTILGRAPHELKDQEAAYLQDILVNQAGFLMRRGAIQGATSLGANLNSRRPEAVVGMYDPQGAFRIMVIYWDVGNFVAVKWTLWGAIYDANMNFISKQPLGAEFASSGATYGPYDTLAAPGLWVHTSQCIDGSIIISGGTGYGQYAKVTAVRWFGGAPPTTTAGGATVSITPVSATNSKVFTASVADVAKLRPGMVIAYYGVIQSIDSTTQFTLTKYSDNHVAGARTVFYGVAAAIGSSMGRGRVSCSVGGNTVTGYGTKWLSVNYPKTSTLPWTLIDPKDGQIIAYSAAAVLIDSDTVLTGATVLRNISMGEAIIVTTGGGNNFSHPWQMPSQMNACEEQRMLSSIMGHFFDSYKGFQFSFAATGVSPGMGDTIDTGVGASPQRVWVNGPGRVEISDLSADGNYSDVVSTVQNDPNGMGIQTGNSGPLLFKSRETFLMRGDDTDNFDLNKIADDGALSCTASAKYKGAVIWAGSKGIWMFDGVNEPVNLVQDSLGDRWLAYTTAFNSNDITTVDGGGYPVNTCHMFVYRDHLFVNLRNTGSQHTVYTDGVARTQNACQFVIYLPNNALSFLTNFNFVGFLPGWGLNQNEAYTLLAQSGSNTHYLFPLSKLFTQGVATTDAILTVNSYDSGSVPTSVGPWFHMESRKYALGDGLRRKTWKQLSLEYLMTNTKRIFVETVAGLNTTGVRQTTAYVGTGLFRAFKNKFNARDQYMSFRLYEDISNRPDTLKLGAWQWAYKLARRGQV